MYGNPSLPVRSLQEHDLAGKARDDIGLAISIEIVGQDRIDPAPGRGSRQDNVLLPGAGRLARAGIQRCKTEEQGQQPAEDSALSRR